MTAEAAADPPLLEQDLCTSCAACCDGTMFTYVPVTREEQAALSDLLTLETRADDAIFHQPCPHSVGQRCQIYALRPQTCRSFRCKTLYAMHKGEIDSAEAFRRVREMLASREQLKTMMEIGESIAEARDRRQKVAQASARTPEKMAFLLKLTAFDLLLDRYFRDKGQQMFSRSPGKAAAD